MLSPALRRFLPYLRPHARLVGLTLAAAIVSLSAATAIPLVLYTGYQEALALNAAELGLAAWKGKEMLAVPTAPWRTGYSVVSHFL